MNVSTTRIATFLLLALFAFMNIHCGGGKTIDPNAPRELMEFSAEARPAPNKQAMSLAKSWSKPNALKTIRFCSNAKSGGRKRVLPATIPSK